MWMYCPRLLVKHTHMPTHSGLRDPCGASALTEPSLVEHNGTPPLKDSFINHDWDECVLTARLQWIWTRIESDFYPIHQSIFLDLAQVFRDVLTVFSADSECVIRLLSERSIVLRSTTVCPSRSCTVFCSSDTFISHWHLIQGGYI